MKAKSRKPKRLIQPEELVGKKWARWYRLTPAQRWAETEKLWEKYLAKRKRKAKSKPKHRVKRATLTVRKK